MALLYLAMWLLAYDTAHNPRRMDAQLPGWTRPKDYLPDEKILVDPNISRLIEGRPIRVSPHSAP